MKKNCNPVNFLLAITTVLLLSSCSGAFTGSFQSARYVKNSGDNYVELNDGSIINGERIKWGRLFSSAVIINDQKFKESEVRGLKENGIYRLRTNKGFLERVVNGKVSVVKETGTRTSTTTVNGQMSTSSYPYTNFYIIRPADERLILIKKNDDIKNVVASCPKALAMVDISNKQLRRAIRENPAYLNDVFDIYNNECKAPEGKKRLSW